MDSLSLSVLDGCSCVCVCVRVCVIRVLCLDIPKCSRPLKNFSGILGPYILLPTLQTILVLLDINCSDDPITVLPLIEWIRVTFYRIGRLLKTL